MGERHFTLHGLQTRGFPNCFIIHTAQSGFTVSFPHAMNEQAKHIAYIINECSKAGANVVEVTAEAEQAWVQQVISMSRMSESFQAECTPGYYNNEGQPNPISVQNGAYGAGPTKFFKVIEACVTKEQCRNGTGIDPRGRARLRPWR